MPDNSKEVFLKTWPRGYRENWAVYGKASGKTEQEVVSKCLSPFFDKQKDCLEIGCGMNFWTDRYLAPNFRTVTSLDLLPSVDFKSKNVRYIEVPDRDFTCYGVEDESVDFVFSFGVFCHMSLEACQKYLNSMFKKLRPGGQVSLYFSNNTRRPHPETQTFDPNVVQWVRNDYETTEAMLVKAGFTQVRDLMPDLFDTMIYGMKS